MRACAYDLSISRWRQVDQEHLLACQLSPEQELLNSLRDVVSRRYREKIIEDII